MAKDLLEKNRVCGQRFRNWVKRPLASAAAAGAGQMPGGDPILLLAMSTRTYDWQVTPLLHDC